MIVFSAMQEVHSREARLRMLSYFGLVRFTIVSSFAQEVHPQEVRVLMFAEIFVDLPEIGSRTIMTQNLSLVVEAWIRL